MKRKLAIVTRHMMTGGVERALIAMLKQFDYSTTEIDLYVEQLGGALFDEIPPQIQVYQLQGVGPKDIFRHPICVLKKAFHLFRLRLHKYSYVKQCHLASQMLLPIEKAYDAAISYHAPNTVPVFFVIDKMKARKKILWLHGDLDTNGGKTAVLKKYYAQYDQIFAVSKSVLESFVKYYPFKRDCTHLFYNYVDIDGIRKKAQQGDTFPKDGRKWHILTIGRLDPQKGLDIAINACHQLVKRGYDFVWYVCGEGLQRTELERLIEKYSLKTRFILLGNRENPYGYLKDCDLYVQPSRTEGYCITVHEAKILARPIIATNIPAIKELLINGETGWLVLIDAMEIASQIEWVFLHPEQCQLVSERLEMARLEIHNQDIECIFK